MMKRNNGRGALYLYLFIIGFFIAGRLGGASLFDNNWSFIHWQHLSGLYIGLWFALSAIAVLLFVSLSDRISSFFASPLKVAIASATLFALLVIFQFDSFLYGGGNLKIAQIAQTEHVIYRWFESGSILITSGLDWFFALFDIHYNAAGVYAWKFFAFTFTGLSLIGCLLMARDLATDTTRRFHFFIILFFGPQAILHFGFIGVEPVVVTASIWFTLFALRLSTRFSIKRLVALWIVVLGGLLLHFSSIYLLPAATYVTINAVFKGRRGRSIAQATAVLSYLCLLFITYYRAHYSLEFTKYLLFFAGKNPHSDYGIFSPRHLGDVLQIFFLAFPQIIVVAYLTVTRYKNRAKHTRLLPTAIMMALSGITVVFILDPINGIVFDYPRFCAYLFPISFLLVVILKDLCPPEKKKFTLVGLLAATCVMFPLSYLPSYIRIDKADPYVSNYLDKHDTFYLNGCLAFRDAYFYKKDLDKANAWEWKLPVKSLDYLNIRGVRELVLGGEVAEALRTLHKMVAQHPYWAEPRGLIASIQMNQGSYRLAKPHIDTCLMLEPYNKEHLMNLYYYHRDVKNYPQALKSIKKAMQFYPEDNEIKTDLMIIYYHSSAFQIADSLADVLLTVDSTFPYPYLIKGFIAEVQKNPRTAVSLFEKFITLAPDEPDTPAIRERRDKIVSELKE